MPNQRAHIRRGGVQDWSKLQKSAVLKVRERSHDFLILCQLGCPFFPARLQSWHIECYDKPLSTDEEKFKFANYSGFCAEIFAKVQPGVY